MSLRFFSLSSGSSGNCYYIGNESEGILIDAGISARKIKKTLTDNGVDISTIVGLCVTHDHSDHIISAGYLGERCGIPVYATRETVSGMNRNFRMAEKLYTAHRFIIKELTFNVGGFEITPFGVSHDGTDNVGYLVKHSGISFAFATDLGCITSSVKKFLVQADYLIIEANYDENMLRNGRYPEYLKRRIEGETGHLSNAATAAFIAGETDCKFSKVFLCHISAENNTPELAHDTVSQAIAERSGNPLEVVSLARTKQSEVYIVQ